MLKTFFQKNLIECGCDEAGRGCLAGPVFAAAVILPKNFKNELLNDSKQISETTRNDLRIVIEKEALALCCLLCNHRLPSVGREPALGSFN